VLNRTLKAVVRRMLWVGLMLGRRMVTMGKVSPACSGQRSERARIPLETWG